MKPRWRAQDHDVHARREGRLRLSVGLRCAIEFAGPPKRIVVGRVAATDTCLLSDAHLIDDAGAIWPLRAGHAWIFSGGAPPRLPRNPSTGKAVIPDSPALQAFLDCVWAMAENDGKPVPTA